MGKLKEKLNLDISEYTKLNNICVVPMSNMRIASITNDKFAVCYVDTNGKGIVFIVKLINDETVIGTSYTFSENTVNSLQIERIDADRTIIFYTDSDNDLVGKAVPIIISDTNLILGATLIFSNEKIIDLHIAKISSTKFIACYNDYNNSSYGSAQLITFSSDYNSILSISPKYVFTSEPINDICATPTN
jgi:hypothetical protein